MNENIEEPAAGVMQAPPTEEPQAAPPMEREQAEPPMKGEQQEMSKADQAYISGLMKLLHGKQTAPMIEEMLQSGPPEKSIPTAALTVNDQMEQAVGKKPPLETCLIAGVYLVQDLIEIGNTAGWFEVVEEKQIQSILQDTMQQYIEKGLKDGSIDPVELQEKIEPLMTEDQRATGLQAAEMTGVPTQANEQTVMSAFGRQKERQGMMKGGGQK